MDMHLPNPFPDDLPGERGAAAPGMRRGGVAEHACGHRHAVVSNQATGMGEAYSASTRGCLVTSGAQFLGDDAFRRQARTEMRAIATNTIRFSRPMIETSTARASASRRPDAKSCTRSPQA